MSSLERSTVCQNIFNGKAIKNYAKKKNLEEISINRFQTNEWTSFFRRILDREAIEVLPYYGEILRR